MHAICQHCGNEADITILGRDQHQHTFNHLNCRLFQEMAQQPGGAGITGQCEHIEKAVSEAIERFRQARA